MKCYAFVTKMLDSQCPWDDDYKFMEIGPKRFFICYLSIDNVIGFIHQQPKQKQQQQTHQISTLKWHSNFLTDTEGFFSFFLIISFTGESRDGLLVWKRETYSINEKKGIRLTEFDVNYKSIGWTPFWNFQSGAKR